MSAAVWGLGGVVSAKKPPRGVPIPLQPRQDRRDSGVSAAVWGLGGVVSPPNPHGASLSSAAQAGPEGLGCIRRCVGVGGVVSSQNPHGAAGQVRLCAELFHAKKKNGEGMAPLRGTSSGELRLIQHRI